MHDEKGYIQFRCEWEDADAPPAPPELIAWRDRLHALGLIGVYPDGIGFGNISVRLNESFLISGTATGSLSHLGPEHFAEVMDYDIAANSVRCRGRVKASSEALSHAAVYVADPAARAVIHVHCLRVWDSLRGRVPTTDPAAEAGTPAMADAIVQLLGNVVRSLRERTATVETLECPPDDCNGIRSRSDRTATVETLECPPDDCNGIRSRSDRTALDGFFVMGGHREGLVAFGPTLDAAGEQLLRLTQV